MNYLNNYQNKLKEVSIKYLNNEISYEEFKEITLDLAKKASAIQAMFKNQVEISSNDDNNIFKFEVKGQVA